MAINGGHFHIIFTFRSHQVTMFCYIFYIMSAWSCKCSGVPSCPFQCQRHGQVRRRKSSKALIAALDPWFGKCWKLDPETSNWLSPELLINPDKLVLACTCNTLLVCIPESIRRQTDRVVLWNLCLWSTVSFRTLHANLLASILDPKPSSSCRGAIHAITWKHNI